MKILTRKQKKQAEFRLLSSIFLLSIFVYIFWVIQLQEYVIITSEIRPENTTPITHNQQEQQDMQFVFVDDDDTQYPIFQKNIHGAWINWDFLFNKKDNDQQNDKNQDNKNNKNKKLKNDKDYVIQPEKKNYLDDEITTIKNTIDDVAISPKYQVCSLPRGWTIKHEEYVLAYQQRTDNTTICNIQKRWCRNGKLSGSYKQKSCKIIKNTAHNDPKVNHHVFTVHHKSNKDEATLIQAQHKPNNYDPSIIEKHIPNTIRDNNKKWGTYEENGTNIIWEKEKQTCLTPRGQKVNHGQFIKAYKRAKGFNNLKCEVELRICLDGQLKGNFEHESCEYIDDSYETYYSNPDNQDDDYTNEQESKEKQKTQKERNTKNMRETKKILEKMKKLLQ